MSPFPAIEILDLLEPAYRPCPGFGLALERGINSEPGYNAK